MAPTPSEAPDALPDEELPGAWTGGEVVHTGDGIYTREFYNRERGLRVIYDLSAPAVSVERGSEDPSRFGTWLPEKEVLERTTDDPDENFETALDLLDEIEGGEIITD